MKICDFCDEKKEDVLFDERREEGSLDVCKDCVLKIYKCKLIRIRLRGVREGEWNGFDELDGWKMNEKGELEKEF